MRVGVLFSGGKDSCLALHLAHEHGHKIACLITIVSQNKESFLFHTPAVSFVARQAEALGIPLVRVLTKGKEGEEVYDLQRALEKAKKEYRIEGVVTGAVRSIYQASRVQRVCHSLQLTCFNPLWLRDDEEHLHDLLKRKIDAIFIHVSAFGFDRSWLGKHFSVESLHGLKKLHQKFGVSLVGEGGEYESFVVDAPLFKKKLVIEKSFVVEESHFSQLRIQKLMLARKT